MSGQDQSYQSLCQVRISLCIRLGSVFVSGQDQSLCQVRISLCISSGSVLLLVLLLVKCIDKGEIIGAIFFDLKKALTLLIINCY